MLRKLYKYDFICSARSIVPVFIIYILVSATFRILTEIDSENVFFQGSLTIMAFAFLILTIALIFFGFASAISRVKKNLFTDEGYLMHTLPVKSWQHLTSKLLNALTWGFFSYAIIGIGFSIAMFGDEALGDLKTFMKYIIEFIKHGGAPTKIFVVLFVVFMFMLIVSLCLFASFFQTLANAFPILKKKVYTYLLLAITYVAFLGGMLLLNYIIQGGVDFFKISVEWQNVFTSSVMIALQIIIDVPMFIISCILMKKRLNLE